MVDPVVKPQHGYFIHRERPFAILIEKLCTKFWNRFIEPSNLGLMPKGYNKNIHGPYVPYRYYGKPDTALKDVKLGELMPWIRRRNKRPMAMIDCMSRALQSYLNRWTNARYVNAAVIWQICLAYSAAMYIVRYTPLHSIHTKSRYH